MYNYVPIITDSYNVVVIFFLGGGVKYARLFKKYIERFQLSKITDYPWVHWLMLMNELLFLIDNLQYKNVFAGKTSKFDVIIFTKLKM